MTRQIEYYRLPAPIPGAGRQVTVLAHGRPEARPKAYLQAGLHGNEHPGLLVLHHLLIRLDELEQEGRVIGRVVTAPMVNPIGLSQFINHELVGRFDLFGGNNFNRAFPDLVQGTADRIRDLLGNDGPANLDLIRTALFQEASSRIATDEADALRLLITRLTVDADLALDLHADGQSLLHLYSHPDHEGLARKLGASLEAPVVLLGFDRTAQSFDDALNLVWTDLAGQFPDRPVPRGCFAATIELRGRADVRDDLAARDAENLIRFLMRQGVIDGDPGDLPALAETAPSPLEGVDHGRAPVGGVAVFQKNLGEMVRKGDVIAEILDPIAPDPQKARCPVKSMADGLLFSINLVRLVRAGQIFFKIAGKEVIKKTRDSLLED